MRFDVFVSYSHRDLDYVRALVAALRRAGLEAWRDEERLAGGAPLKDSIAKGLASCDHMLVVCTRAWAESLSLEKSDKAWCYDEANAFDMHYARGHAEASARRLIPLLRIPHAELPRRLPFDRETTGIPGAEAPDDPAMIWQIAAAIRGRDPGPQAEWSREGRALLEEGARPVAPSANVSELALRVDRTRQWDGIVEMARDARSAVCVVPGPAGMAHRQLLDRLRHDLAREREPAGVGAPLIHELRWHRRYPDDTRDLWEGLARQVIRGARASGDDDGARLRHELARRWRDELSRRSVYVLHDPIVCGSCVDGPFGIERLVRYYTELVPRFEEELVGDRSPIGGLKWIQPVQWPLPESDLPLAQRVKAWWRGRAARSVVEEALATIRSRLDKSHLAFVELPPLGPFEREDLERWADEWRRELRAALGDDEALERFLRSLEPDARPAGEILNCVQERLRFDMGGKR